MIRPLSFLLPLLLCSCLGRGDDTILASPVQLSPQDAGLTRIGQVEVLALHRLGGGMGGISGIAWDGDDLLAVSDVGDWLRWRVDSDADGRPLAVSRLRSGRLGGVSGGKRDGDSEEIERDGGSWLVSFERDHRVWRYGADLSQPARPLNVPAAIARLDDNEGIEAMARLDDGRLLLIAEGEDDEPASPAWLGGEESWRTLSYPHHQAYRPTAAAALPDGGVLVVERRYSPLAGPGMRLVRIAAATLAAGSLAGEELARFEPPLVVDNFEGLALRHRADGRLVATIVSDDNFNPLQSTLMLTVLLP